MMVVRVQALPREGFSFRPRAGRIFPSGEPVTLEVVDDAKDPTIEVEKIDSAGKKYMQEVPDPKRISKKLFEEMILPDPILKVLADGETISVLSQAALDAARKQASDLAGKLVDSESARAEMGAKLDAALAELADARVQLAAALEAAKDAEAPPASDKGDHPDKGSTGKGGKAR